jgi:pimeloyl-ACP methyl ester carboxylesterase
MKQRLGYQRDWVWRGWKIRYTYLPAKNVTESSQPPLILIHGFGASIDHWRKNFSALREYYTVYAIDLLGFGASYKAFTNYQIKLWADLIFDFWQTLINFPAVLVGNSLGSLVALTAASHYPQMIQGLVMVNLPDVSQRQEMLPKFIQPVVATIESIFTTPILLKPLFYFLRRPLILRNWAKLAYYDQNAVTDELIEILATPTLDDNAESAFCALVQSVNQADFADSAKKMLSNLDIPLLLIWGQEDKIIPVSLAPKLAAVNPRIELQILNQLGHCPFDESPDIFNNLIISWTQNMRDNKNVVV